MPPPHSLDIEIDDRVPVYRDHTLDVKRYAAHMEEQAGLRDEVDDIVAAWHAERPDLDVEPLQVLSRISRLARHLDRARRTAFASHDLEPWEFDMLSALRRQGPPYQLTPGGVPRPCRPAGGGPALPADPGGAAPGHARDLRDYDQPDRPAGGCRAGPPAAGSAGPPGSARHPHRRRAATGRRGPGRPGAQRVRPPERARPG